MELIEITEKEYKSFWEKHPLKCFMSAPEIARLNENSRVYFLGLEKKGEIIAAVFIRGTKRRFGYDYYAPRGPLIDFVDEEILKFFISEVKQFLKQRGGYIFRIDPNIELIERDIGGNIVEGGVDNGKIVNLLLKLGFKKSRYVKDVSQVTWEFALPVEGKSEDEVLSEMSANTRRRIKQAMEYGISVDELDRDSLSEFYDVLKKTAARKNFSVREISYFKKMYELFSPDNGIKYVSVSINPSKSIKKLQDKLEQTRATVPKTIRDKKDRNDLIKSLETRIKNVEKMFPEIKNERVVLSSGMFLTTKPEILHLFGGNIGEYMKLDGQYVLQWEMIKRAIRGKYERYNFYGIPENINTHPEGYGIYEFKRGFSGRVLQLIGEYELPLSFKYYLYKIISSIKH